nr:hypothetical protein [Prevotella sp.]
MKKLYIKPRAMLVLADIENLLAGSDGPDKWGTNTDGTSGDITNAGSGSASSGGQVIGGGSGSRAKGFNAWSAWDD